MAGCMKSCRMQRSIIKRILAQLRLGYDCVGVQHLVETGVALQNRTESRVALFDGTMDLIRCHGGITVVYVSAGRV